MNKKLLILFSALLFYIALYAVVRVECHGYVIVMAKFNRNAAHVSKTFDTVEIQEPVSGFRRYAMKAVYDVFYPIGMLDRVTTGRIYESVDARYFIYTPCSTVLVQTFS
jgi:hypothetical protein